MVEEYDGNKLVILFYKKYLEPFFAIFIFFLLFSTGILLYQDNQLKKEISQNCGWIDEDYRCYCQKHDIEDIENYKNNFQNQSYSVVYFDPIEPVNLTSVYKTEITEINLSDR